MLKVYKRSAVATRKYDFLDVNDTIWNTYYPNSSRITDINCIKLYGVNILLNDCVNFFVLYYNSVYLKTNCI